MKALRFLIGIQLIANVAIAQLEPFPLPTNITCEAALPICGNVKHDFDMNPDGETCDAPTTLFYSFHFNAVSANAITISPALPLVGTYVYYGPFASGGLNPCVQVSMNNSNFITGTFELGPNGATYTSTYNLPSEVGYYILAITTDQCEGSIGFQENGDRSLVCETKIPCTDCVTSFSPTPGRYIVSGWVKENVNDPLITTYTNSKINVSFPGSAAQTVSLLPSGTIIDGWQRIEKEITVPVDATGITIELFVSNGVAFFDDIRFHPFDGSMMSYVYDPLSLRLMAELDERNYATLYEYDEEGKLIRVKKETEKGVMTIQENRDNIIKKQP